jgi:hypothetical protein
MMPARARVRKRARMGEHRRGTSAVVEAHALPRRLWLYALVIGLVVLLVAAFVTAITEDTILMPNVIVVGSFLASCCPRSPRSICCPKRLPPMR